MSGLLSVVATPIGNLEDMTLRAIRTLKEADTILAEDTRRTKTLCVHFGITTRLRSFHAHTPNDQVDVLVEEMRKGASLAIVTDAGTPLVSDPGARLVSAAAAAGVRVEPIPGASAPLAALAAAGLRIGAFRFVGFLPRSGGKRAADLELLARAPEATVLFESPNRVAGTLADLAELIPERPAVVARELTKMHEEIARGTLLQLAGRFAAQPVRGEVTLVVEGAPVVAVEIDPEALVQQAKVLLAEGARTKEAARTLAETYGLTVRDAYALVLRAASA